MPPTSNGEEPSEVGEPDPQEPSSESSSVAVESGESEQAQPAEPVPFSLRLKTTIRIGAFIGFALGLVGFVVATAFWAENASAVEGEASYSIVIVTRVTSLILGTALVSIPFGALAAGLARAAATWTHPGMRLRSSPGATAWWGAVVGLVLGVIAGAVLALGVGSPVEGQEGLAQLPVLGTLLVTMLGGTVLGSITAVITQVFAVPMIVEDASAEEIERTRTRLLNAVQIPLTALGVLLVLVIPIGWTLVQAAHMSLAAAPVIALLVAGGILTFATLGGNRPNVRISVGEFTIALVGILIVVGTVVAVLFARGPTHPEANGPGGTVTIEALPDITFDATEWSVSEGDVTFVYEDEADIVHTLTIEGREDQLDLRVEGQGDTDTGSVSLPPGTYTLFCTIRGHRELGMEGQLTVKPAPDEASQ